MLGAFKFFRMEPRTLYLSATISPEGDDLLSRTILRSVTVPKKEGLPIQVKEHFIADVRLSPVAAETPNLDFTPPSALPIEAHAIYKTFLHGPAYQVLERAQVDGNTAVGMFPNDLPANTLPISAVSFMAPRLVDMIHWLIQSFDEFPQLVEGSSPEGLLTKAERERLLDFAIPKRRRDWLLGRWTAKNLVQHHLYASTGSRPYLLAIVIDNDPDGAPYAAVVVDSDRSASPNRLPVSLSISHSGDHALSAVWAGSGVQIGADIERVEARDEAFMSTYFTPEEIALVNGASSKMRDTLVTVIWSAKEAALKALRLGLRADTLALHVCPKANPPLTFGGRFPYVVCLRSCQGCDIHCRVGGECMVPTHLLWLHSLETVSCCSDVHFFAPSAAVCYNSSCLKHSPVILSEASYGSGNCT